MSLLNDWHGKKRCACGNVQAKTVPANPDSHSQIPTRATKHTADEMSTTAAVKAIQGQFQDLLNDPPPGINAGPIDDDWYEWSAVIQGPENTPYAGGVFFLSIKFSDSYPFDPPQVHFTTPIYHPNVNDEGGICLSILFKQCSWDNGWSPALSITSVLISIMVLMTEPATDHSLQPEIAKQYDTDREAFNKAAREHTKQHAM